MLHTSSVAQHAQRPAWAFVFLLLHVRSWAIVAISLTGLSGCDRQQPSMSLLHNGKYIVPGGAREAATSVRYMSGHMMVEASETNIAFQVETIGLHLERAGDSFELSIKKDLASGVTIATLRCKLESVAAHQTTIAYELWVDLSKADTVTAQRLKDWTDSAANAAFERAHILP